MSIQSISELYTTSEIAERLKVSPLTVRRAIRNGDLEACRVGRGIRISEDHLREYLEANTIGGCEQ